MEYSGKRSYTGTSRLIVDGVQTPCCSSSMLKEHRIEADGINELLEVVGVLLIDDGVFIYKNEAVNVICVEKEGR